MENIRIIYSPNLNTLLSRNMVSIEHSCENLLNAIISSEDKTGLQSKLCSTAQFFSDEYTFWIPDYDSLEKSEKLRYSYITKKIKNMNSFKFSNIQYLNEKFPDFVNFILPKFEIPSNTIDLFLSNDPVLNRIYFYNLINSNKELLANNIAGLMAVCGLKFLFPTMPEIETEERLKMKDRLKADREEYLDSFRKYIYLVKKGIVDGSIDDIMEECELTYNQEIIVKTHELHRAVSQSGLHCVKGTIGSVLDTAVSIGQAVLVPNPENIIKATSELLLNFFEGSKDSIKTNYLAKYSGLSYIYKLENVIDKSNITMT